MKNGSLSKNLGSPAKIQITDCFAGQGSNNLLLMFAGETESRKIR